ncbi:hypothetical protein ACKI2N_000355 [Cupriavidus sp. 30B13]|uniref:hypothetical protein n=1 Tax=Cupriavidus sp. 30B13 TaxID=3384241 RepID=UPI003B8F16B5
MRLDQIVPIDMRHRVIELIDSVTESHRPFKHMEDMTGIKANNWKNTYRLNQRVVQEMVEVIGELWPQYAYWLVTGKTDEEHGHTSPIRDRIARDMEKVRQQEG